MNDIFEYIKKGKKEQAIEVVRESMGLSLQDAKEYVEYMIHYGGIEQEKTYRSSDISIIDGMEGHKFEYFCAELLKKIGFSDVTVTPGSGDQGVDILAFKEGIKYAIQCKNYSRPLSNTPIQEVTAGKQFYSCHVGVVMTNSTFTTGAVNLAEATNVLLWDRSKLEDFISMAGGFKALGYEVSYDSIEEDIEFDEIVTDRDISKSVEETNIILNECSKAGGRRKMRITSNICTGWSVVCLMILVFGIVDKNQEMIMMGLSEGLFVLVFGMMFGRLAKSEKNESYVTICGVKIQKVMFVFISIVLAFTLFGVAMLLLEPELIM